MKVLVLGASGMLGNAVFRELSKSGDLEVIGSVRTGATARLLPEELRRHLACGFDVTNVDDIATLLSDSRPNVVINCVGLVKQLREAEDVLSAAPLNTLLPHRLSRLCALVGARLIHMSTDCVFSGSKGMYLESDLPDANDVYGRTKLLGELHDAHTVTLRTSIIGHELSGARSLVGWFLAQQGRVKGFRKAIFSGLPTVEVARTIRDHVLPNASLHGLYHVSAEPINKYELLKLVADEYRKDIKIEPEDEFAINRSLDSSRFRAATGFRPKPWPELVTSMREFQ